MATHFPRIIAALLFSFGAGAASLTAAENRTAADGIDFFEKRIRPLLVERCYECHSTEKKIKGGLRLDSREGWARGGDTGPALVPGDPNASLLMKAVRYEDPDFQMPPKRRLDPSQVADFEQWIRLGAPDPRAGAVVAAKPKQVGLTIEEGRKFWSFIRPKKSAPPPVRDANWPRTDIDRFILARIEGKNLHPVSDADSTILVRRLYYDLIGLPPTPEQIDAFLQSAIRDRQSAIARLIDDLLASAHFGERWGRHWLDVARFAESSGGGRTLLFKDAWRYRDYVIEAFNSDMPYDQFIREQVAGDLLAARDWQERRRQLTGTAFLALGPTNYEEQDKQALRMDVVDEQIDTVGKAVLGMTIGCARCHDHKFDPVPTRDYYALAGIFKSTRTLFNYTDNVARWIDSPLPAEAQKEADYQAHEQRVNELEKRIASVKSIASAAAAAAHPPDKAIAVSDLPGIVVDDVDAKKVGEWLPSRTGDKAIGAGYIHDGNTGKGEKTVTFVPKIERAGKYEVRLAYKALKNRADNAPVTILHADGENTVRVNMQEPPPIDGRFISLGEFRFEKNGEGYVLVSNEGTTGHVVVDAVQLLAPEEAEMPLAVKGDPESAKAVAELKELQKELKGLKAGGPPRELAMSVREEDEIGDTNVCIRGNIRNLGDKVPRGFLTIALTGEAPRIPETDSGRRQLADWLSSPANPLTARVMANRVWHHLFGAGLVRTTDNFGTTGEPPSHPELLDYLAVRFVENGWSVKKLIREIMLSRTYQLSGATTTAPLVAADPDNRLFGHANRRRLDAESIRDTILAISGELRLDLGGPNIGGAGPIDANKATAANVEYGYKFEDRRRSVYTPAFRNNRLELFEAFDFSDINAPQGRRNTSTVATQALYLMNHPFVIEQSRLAARRALAANLQDDRARIERACRETLGRPATDGEQRLARRFLSASSEAGSVDARLEAWASFYQVLFCSADFRYVN